VREFGVRPGQASLTSAPDGWRDEIEARTNKNKKFSGPWRFQATPSRDQHGEGVVTVGRDLRPTERSRGPTALSLTGLVGVAW